MNKKEIKNKPSKASENLSESVINLEDMFKLLSQWDVFFQSVEATYHWIELLHYHAECDDWVMVAKLLDASDDFRRNLHNTLPSEHKAEV